MRRSLLRICVTKITLSLLFWHCTRLNTAINENCVSGRGGDWKTGGACHMENLPELRDSLSSSKTWPKLNIATQLLASRSNQPKLRDISVLNITAMSSRRKDGHLSLYYLGPTAGPASIHRQDCSHWCLPGVPDSWNELLFALLLKHDLSRTWNSTSRTQDVWYTTGF